MLNAAEATIYEGAADEAEVKTKRARLYAPPDRRAAGARPVRRQPGERPAAGAGRSLSDAKALMAQMAAEDAQLSRRG